jgi:ANTAR domain
MRNRELWLARTMTELAEAYDERPDEGSCGRLFVTRLAESLAPAEVAWLGCDTACGLSGVMASTQRAFDLVRRENKRGEGPTYDCCRTRQGILNRSIADVGGLWPDFAAAARGSGIGMVSSLPVTRRGLTLGALSVLTAGDYVLGEAQAGLAQTLAEFAVAASIRRHELRRSAETARQLQLALDSRVLIEQAKGAVAALLDLSPEAAFELLRSYARRHGRKLTEVASETIRGEISPDALRSVPQPRIDWAMQASS